MQAIILAAGMGKRLKDLTKDQTKCMVEVNGERLIKRVLNQLEHLGLSKIVLVVGYQAEGLRQYIATVDIKTPVVYVENYEYDKTNNIYSLYLARHYLLEEDTILLESDLIFEDAVLKKLVQDPRDTVAMVDKYEDWMDGTCLVLDENDNITQFISGKFLDYTKKDEYYKTVNIYKFSKSFSRTYYVPFLEAYSKALGNNEYYEQVIKVITMLDAPVIKACRLEGERWYEIDDVQDLNIASSIFADAGNKLTLLQNRYGGYWRYPKMLDFCYLVNPFFPPKQMLEEMKSNFYQLTMQYPSGMAVNSMLAGKMFGVRSENIVVGNGAAELIKALLEHMSGGLGIIRPTFEEYPNRYPKEKTVPFFPDRDGFSYTAEDIIEFFENKEISGLVLINPDNPTGNYINKSGLLTLIRWAEEQKITLVIDESFSDFADEADNTLLQQELLDDHPDLVVIKSISKSYGVPGMRLGVLASGNRQYIEMLKRDVSIWNINSFGEYFFQIEEKYSGEYREGLQKLREERDCFINELKKIDAFRVFPSQANYIMVELLKGNSRELAETLLNEHNILIKDLSAKLEGQYIRLSVRNHADNGRLLEVLRKISL